MQKYLYDVFISYHHKDQAWIESELLPRLESAGLRVCIASRDFSPGKPKVVNMQDAVRSSCFTLLVVTPSWIEDDWGQYQSILSVTQDPGGGSGRTIPIILKQCDIPAFLSILTSVDFTRPEHREEAWHSLFTALGVKSPEPIPTAEQKAAGGGDALPPREYFRSYALSNDLTARRIVQEMCSELPPSYYDFIRQYLLPSGTNLAEDPFASKCLSGNTHIVSRGDLEQQFQQAISSKNDILVRGRIGSGKSTLINRGPALIGENSLAVSWMITSDEVAPDEIRFHLTPQMLARRIFLSYWEALWAPPSPGCPTSQISPNWSLLDMLKWFHVRYTLDDSRIPPGLKLEDWKSDPRHQIEFLPDTLKTLLRVVSSSMDTPAGATEDNTRERKRRELRKMMDDRLSSNELRTICFDCDFNLRETPLASIDVIGYCEKHEPEAELNLLQWLYENRSDQKWPNPWGVMPEPGDMQEISFEQIWIFVDGTDRLALSTQVRFIKEARAISKAYAPNLHFVIAVSHHVQAQMMGEGHSA